MFVRGTPCSSWVLCGLGKKERHKAATCNCAPQGGREERDIFLHKLIQWLGLLRNISCSSWVLCGLGKKERHKAATCNCVPQGGECYLQTCTLLSLRLGRLFAPTGDLL